MIRVVVQPSAQPPPHTPSSTIPSPAPQVLLGCDGKALGSADAANRHGNNGNLRANLMVVRTDFNEAQHKIVAQQLMNALDPTGTRLFPTNQGSEMLRGYQVKSTG